REAMVRAEVGDEQIGDDPSVNLLCERTADLLGKQAAVFMPSGTMCNVAATLVHCRPGDEIVAHETAHIIAREGGAHAALGGFQIMPLPGADGQYSPASRPGRLRARWRRAGIPLGSISPRDSGRRSAACSPARPPSSMRSGAGSSGSAARCARLASALPPASTRLTTMSIASRTTTPM